MNDEMEMVGGSGTKCKPQYLRECWFLIHIFLHQMRKQCLEFALPNPGEICKHLAGAYNSNSHTRRLLLSYFSMRKQAGKSIQWRESFKEVCLRKAQHYWSSLKEEKPLQFMIPLTLLPKNHNLFCESKEGMKKRGRKKRKIRDH
jgi:hypothetical protein